MATLLSGTAQATITVSNQFLLDDMQFSSNDFGLNDSSVGEKDLWRYKARDPADQSDVQIYSSIADSMAGNNDRFSPPVNVFANGTALLPYMDGLPRQVHLLAMGSQRTTSRSSIPITPH